MSHVTVISEIAPSARVAPGARIGPYCVVGPNVTIGPKTVLVRRVSVMGRTRIGSDNVFQEGCVLGADPQDLKYAGAATMLLIGHRNHFGRNVTAHIGTEVGGFLTRIGDDNVLGDGSHVAHDCYVDDGTTLGRYAMLAGHIRVQTGAVVEDFAGVHHFVTIGRHARVGSMTPVRRDVPPYTYFIGSDDGASPAVRGPHRQGIATAKLAPHEEMDLLRLILEFFGDESALQTKIEQALNMGVEGQAQLLCQFCQQSLQGVFGRYRELFRGKAPPEAAEHMPPELREAPRRPMP